MSTLKNKTIWITGASSGIGEALAYECARHGARLVLSARRKDELERVVAHCEGRDKHIIVGMDLADSNGFTDLADKVWQQTNGVDLLINNAGLSQRALVMDTSLDVHRTIMEINYFGTVALTQAILPLMLERGAGGVITVSSLVGKFTTPLRSAYAASKHAITAYMDSLRAELHDTGLQFTTIYPGFIHTNLTYKALLGDGTEQNTMDRAQKEGMPPEVCASKIMKAYMKGKDEAFVGGKETRAVLLKRLFPKLFAKIVRKAKVT
ncbi:SDR family oxidoreductase [Kangiella sediminilitoris]|uniref:Short-chain dehydrogenase n=1 Tax=Kangiella sediminilitoris TaxID=1144748 RepID=A0A1B3B8T9_9GAMM|nr:SDR family oxidoreductase [Kangiella sediminilitoris]AOE49224.1 short-chain dehydrogenase [Kangiella sediminilitoris]